MERNVIAGCVCVQVGCVERPERVTLPLISHCLLIPPELGQLYRVYYRSVSTLGQTWEFEAPSVAAAAVPPPVYVHGVGVAGRVVRQAAGACRSRRGAGGGKATQRVRDGRRLQVHLQRRLLRVRREHRDGRVQRCSAIVRDRGMVWPATCSDGYQPISRKRVRMHARALRPVLRPNAATAVATAVAAAAPAAPARAVAAVAIATAVPTVATAVVRRSEDSGSIGTGLGLLSTFLLWLVFCGGCCTCCYDYGAWTNAP